MAIRLCLSNGFSNMSEIRNAVNDILQIKPAGFATDTGRLVINSTLGGAGCFDIATRMGLDRRPRGLRLDVCPVGIEYRSLPGAAGAGAERRARRDRADPGLLYFADRLHLPGRRSERRARRVSDRHARHAARCDVADRAGGRWTATSSRAMLTSSSAPTCNMRAIPPPPQLEDDSGESGPASGPAKTQPAQTAAAGSAVK